MWVPNSSKGVLGLSVWRHLGWRVCGCALCWYSPAPVKPFGRSAQAEPGLRRELKSALDYSLVTLLFICLSLSVQWISQEFSIRCGSYLSHHAVLHSHCEHFCGWTHLCAQTQVLKAHSYEFFFRPAGGTLTRLTQECVPTRKIPGGTLK